MANFKPFYSSHRNDEHSGQAAPTTAHMALQTGAVGDASGILAIPEGSHLFFIEDPRRADGIIEVILEKVVFKNHTLKEVRLVAYTRSTKSTRKLRLRADWEGRYESGLEGDQKKAGERMNPTEEDE